MAYQRSRFEKLVSLIEQHAPQEGANYADLDGVGTYKASAIRGREPAVDLPAIWMIGQGRKLSSTKTSKTSCTSRRCSTPNP